MTAELAISLKVAAARYGFPKDRLRSEGLRGRLVIFRMSAGGKWYTTDADVRRWVELCREDGERRVYTSTGREANGLSETERASSAQAALQLHLQRRKSSLPSTSAANINRKGAAIR